MHPVEQPSWRMSPSAHRIEDGINAVRMTTPRAWFDAKKCARGVV